MTIANKNYSQSFFFLNNLHNALPGAKVGVKQINLLTPNVDYSGRTAPLTSNVAFYIFIQQI